MEPPNLRKRAPLLPRTGTAEKPRLITGARLQGHLLEAKYKQRAEDGEATPVHIRVRSARTGATGTPKQLRSWCAVGVRTTTKVMRQSSTQAAHFNNRSVVPCWERFSVRAHLGSTK
jgi:hypothetical protein